MSWEDFEIRALNYLKNNFKLKNINFTLLGGSNSNDKDIHVKLENKLLFVIEAKQNKSQIAQFVLIPDIINKTFKLGNIKGSRKKTKNIIEFMDKNFKRFESPTTKGIEINCLDKFKFDCIDDYLEENNIQFIITACKKNNIKIINKENFKNHFKANCIYRKKKSGSRDYKFSEDLKKNLISHFNNLKDVIKDGKKTKLMFKLCEQFQIKKQRYFKINSENMYLSPIKNNKNSFYLKKLSSTNNPTVIFQIEYKNNTKDDSDILKNILKKKIK